MTQKYICTLINPVTQWTSVKSISNTLSCEYFAAHHQSNASINLGLIARTQLL